MDTGSACQLIDFGGEIFVRYSYVKAKGSGLLKFGGGERCAIGGGNCVVGEVDSGCTHPAAGGMDVEALAPLVNTIVGNGRMGGGSFSRTTRRQDPDKAFDD